MKYYADYWNERVYAVEPDGQTECKYLNSGYFDEIKKIVVRRFKRPDDKPWLWEENGVGNLVEPMTKEEFESFGKTWVWNNIPNPDENKKHSWRNYIKLLNS